MTGIFFLIVRVFASPVVNVFQKKLTNSGMHPVAVVLIVYIFFSVLSLGYLLNSGIGHYTSVFWIYMIMLGIIDALGNIFLIRSLKTIDLSVFGPLNAYKPVIALILSYFIVKEVPSWAGIAGVLVIIGGSYFLYVGGSPQAKFIDFLKSGGIGYRFLSIFLTSVAAVLSKKVILMSSPMVTLSYWSLIGLPPAILFYILGPGGLRSPDKKSILWFAGLIASFLILQLFSLYTFKFVFVGYSLALFQLSSVISVFFGSRIFREENIAPRYLACLIMIVGAGIILFWG